MTYISVFENARTNTDEHRWTCYIDNYATGNHVTGHGSTPKAAYRQAEHKIRFIRHNYVNMGKHL